MRQRGKKLVRKNNDENFLKDIARVRDVLMRAYNGSYYHIKKRDVWAVAKTKRIDYYITDEIFVSVRDAMVII